MAGVVCVFFFLSLSLTKRWNYQIIFALTYLLMAMSVRTFYTLSCIMCVWNTAVLARLWPCHCRWSLFQNFLCIFFAVNFFLTHHNYICSTARPFEFELNGHKQKIGIFLNTKWICICNRYYGLSRVLCTFVSN